MKNLKPKTVQTYCWIIFGLGAFIGFMGAAAGSTVVPVIGIVILLSGIAFRFTFYRCPHCGKYLDRSTGEFCPKCGEKVNE